MTDRNDRRKLHKMHHPDAYGGNGHPLDGLTVAAWVAEARAGWPKVPVPRDPRAAAARVMKAHGSAVDYWEVG